MYIFGSLFFSIDTSARTHTHILIAPMVPTMFWQAVDFIYAASVVVAVHSFCSFFFLAVNEESIKIPHAHLSGILNSSEFVDQNEKKKKH